MKTTLYLITLTLITTIVFGACFFIGTCLTIGVCLLANAMFGLGLVYTSLIQSGLVLTIGFLAGCIIFSVIEKSDYSHNK